jgi:type I restriction enzyme R subunit
LASGIALVTQCCQSLLVERIVTVIFEMVCLVRIPGCQNTKAGEREGQKDLRKVIYVKYQVKD